MPIVKANRISIHYTERGRGSPVVFGHSLMLDGTMYDALAERLAHSHRTIQLDFRGHGKSDKPDVECTLDDLVTDVTETLRALEIDSFVWVGLSMGGMVGMRLALRFPSRIKGLVLLDTTAEEEERRGQFEQWAEMSKDMATNEPAVKMILGLLTAPRFVAEKPTEAARLKKVLTSNDPRGIYRTTLAILRRKSILAELGAIHCPTLLVVGEEDVALPPKLSEAIHRAIPGAELLRVPGSGHLSVLERPEVVIPAIETFCRRVHS